MCDYQWRENDQRLDVSSRWFTNPFGSTKRKLPFDLGFCFFSFSKDGSLIEDLLELLKELDGRSLVLRRRGESTSRL